MLYHNFLLFYFVFYFILKFLIICNTSNKSLFFTFARFCSSPLPSRQREWHWKGNLRLPTRSRWPQWGSQEKKREERHIDPELRNL